MPITQIVDVPNVSPISANNDFTIGVPVGNVQYEALGLEMGGTFTKAQLTDISVEISGKPIQFWKSATHLELVSAYYGRGIQSNEVVLPFRREEWLNAAESRLFNLGMSDVPVFQINGSIGAATNPTLTAYAAKTQAPSGDGSVEGLRTANRLGAFTKVKKFTFAPTGSGDFEIDKIPREGFAQAIHIIQGSGNVDGVQVFADGVRVWNADDARMESFVERHGRTRQSNVYHIDWMLQNEIGGQLPLVPLQEFRLILDMAGADTLDVYVEYLSGFSGI